MGKIHKQSKAVFTWLLSCVLALSMMGGMLPVHTAEAENLSPNGGFYAYVPYTPDSPVVTYAFETPKTGIVHVEFDVTPLADAVDGHIAFNTADTVMSFSNDRKINIMLRSNGHFAANDNSSTKEPDTVISYVKDQTYHVKLTIDVDAKIYSATVDGDALAADYKFRDRNPRDIANIGVMGVVSLEGDFKVTNISEKLVGLVDNDAIGMDETENPREMNGTHVYYVGPTHKFKKIQDVVALLQPGDTVEVAGDADYPAPIFISENNAGTEAQPITLKGIAKNGKKPVIKTLNATNMIEIAADNYVFDNFAVAGNLAEVLAKYPGVTYENIMNQSGAMKNEISNQTVFRAIFYHADNLVVRNSVVHDARNGILGADMGAGNITVEYSEFYHNGTKAGQHNLYLASDEVAHPGATARVQYNYIHDSNAGNGLKTRVNRNEVYYNWFENNYNQSLELIGPDPGFDITEDEDGNEVYAFITAEELRKTNPEYGEFYQREDSDVVGNVIIHTRGDLVRLGGDGTSDTSLRNDDYELILGDDGLPVKAGPAHGQTYGRYRLVNNTFIGYQDDANSGSDPVRAVRIEFGVESVELYNNVFYKLVGQPFSIVNEYTALDEINTANWASGHRQVKGANNWVQADSTDVPSEWTGTLIGSDPGFVNARAEVKNYALKPNSPLAAAGITLNNTVATWEPWTNTLYDFSVGSWPVEDFDFKTYTGTPVELTNKDTAFPNPLMSLGFTPINPKTMTVAQRSGNDSIDIGAIGLITVNHPVQFEDMANHWAAPYVQILASRSGISGTDPGKFMPNAKVTGMQIVEMLTTMFDETQLSNIPLDSLISTYGQSTQDITREQMAVYAVAFAKALSIELPKLHAAEKFKDEDSIVGIAKGAVQDLQMAGIISGRGNGLFEPRGTATRAEAATVIVLLAQLAMK